MWKILTNFWMETMFISRLKSNESEIKKKTSVKSSLVGNRWCRLNITLTADTLQHSHKFEFNRT